MKRNVLKSLFCVLLLSVCIVSGCQDTEDKEKVQITLMHGWGGTLETHKLMQDIYAEFSVENPDIELISIPYSDSSIAVEKANDMLAVGKMPDIISTNGKSYFVSNAVKQGKALDLMPFIEDNTILKNEIHPSVLATWITDKGKLYTVPDALEVAGYWYNKEYFKKAGLANQDGEVILPKTWDEFFNTVTRLDQWIQTENPNIAVFALDDMQVVESLVLARIAGEGEQGLALVQQAPVSMNNQIINKAVADIVTLYDYSKNVDSIENARQNFGEGKSVIYFNGVWESDLLSGSNMKDQIDYANYPTESGVSLSYVSPSSGYVICNNENRKKVEACVRFLNYILSEKVQTKIALETGQAPSNPNINRDELILEYPMLGNAVSTAYQADIQIKTITSVWSEDKINLLRQYIRQQVAEGR